MTHDIFPSYCEGKLRVCFECHNFIFTNRKHVSYCTCTEEGVAMRRVNNPLVKKYAFGKILNEKS